MDQSCKIDILMERYDITPPTDAYGSLDEYLLARWTGDDGRPADGYGTLATWFNRRLLRNRYEANGRETLGVRLDSEFEALTGDDDVLRAEVVDDLAQDGIDADRLREEFISRSTMRRHLNDCLDGEKSLDRGDSDWEQTSIEMAVSQAERRIRDALGSLASKGEFPDIDTVEISVDVSVACVDDPYQVPLEEAISSGLDCDESTTGSEAPKP
jgi:hypothetical protein